MKNIFSLLLLNSEFQSWIILKIQEKYFLLTNASQMEVALKVYPRRYLRGSIIVWLTSGLFCLDSAVLLMSNEQKFYLFGQTQTSQAGGQLSSDTSPCGEWSLIRAYSSL